MKKRSRALMTGLGLLVSLIIMSCAVPQGTNNTPKSADPTSSPTIGLPLTPVPPSKEQETVNVPASAEKAVAWAESDVAGQTGRAADTVQLLAVDRADWRDSSLGCPKPGMVYLQVITPGYRILVQAGDTIYEYHSASDSDRAVLCKSGPAATWKSLPIPTSDSKS
jgi:hypothetical protein